MFTFFSYDDHEIVSAVDGVIAADGQVFTVRIALAEGFVLCVGRFRTLARQRVDDETNMENAFTPYRTSESLTTVTKTNVVRLLLALLWKYKMSLLENRIVRRGNDETNALKRNRR